MNTVKIIKKQQVVCGIITEMGLIILFLMMMTLLLLITMQTLQKKLFSFKYKSNITRKTSNANRENGENSERENAKIKKNLEIVVLLKYLSDFWRTLDMPLITYQESLTLTWSENCALTDITTLQEQLKEIIQQEKE